jgi:hypothetical protein
MDRAIQVCGDSSVTGFLVQVLLFFFVTIEPRVE